MSVPSLARILSRSTSCHFFLVFLVDDNLIRYRRNPGVTSLAIFSSLTGNSSTGNPGVTFNRQFGRFSPRFHCFYAPIGSAYNFQTRCAKLQPKEPLDAELPVKNSLGCQLPGFYSLTSFRGFKLSRNEEMSLLTIILLDGEPRCNFHFRKRKV